MTDKSDTIKGRILLFFLIIAVSLVVNGLINKSFGTGFWCPFCNEHGLMKGLRHEE